MRIEEAKRDRVKRVLEMREREGEVAMGWGGCVG
jgi:hypothetical protein